MKRTFIYSLLAIVSGGLAGLLITNYVLDKERENSVSATPASRVPVHLTGGPQNTITSNSRNVVMDQNKWPDFTYAAEVSVEAVVHVSTIYQRRQESLTLLDYVFGYRTPHYESRPTMGSGSGVILTTDGYIVTNNHVIANANAVQVTLYDKRTFPARVIGTDPATDIAVLKIDAEELPFLTFGNSDSLRLGEWVLAIGNPYNLNSTITAGIVSAKGRNLPSNDGRFKIESFIQTDAAVNPGNSGGALVNTRGELIGINTAIASPTGSFSGYSFAVPTIIVQKVVEDIIQYGNVQRAMLGVMMIDITDALAKRLNLPHPNGVLITQLVRGGVAEKAGIKAGDVIIRVNGTEVNSASMVQEQISRFRPDQQVEIVVERDGKTKHFNAILNNETYSTSDK
jgi:Do/DeqQ family serine protease